MTTVVLSITESQLAAHPERAGRPVALGSKIPIMRWCCESSWLMAT